jgi:hypothetical protein
MASYGHEVLPSTHEFLAAEVAHRRRSLQRAAVPRRRHRLRVWAGMALVRLGLVLVRPGWDRPSAFRGSFDSLSGANCD